MKLKLFLLPAIAVLAAGLSGCGSLFSSDAGEVPASRPAPLTDGQQFQDWRTGCEKINDGQQENCFIFQTVVNSETNQPVLQMAVGRTPPQNQLMVLLTLPREVDVDSGIDIITERGKLAHINYQGCLEKGCLAGLELNRSIIDQLKAEQSIKIVVSDGTRTIALPISMRGFDEGLAALGG